MQNKFHYILVGVGVTLTVIIGAMSLIFYRVDAKVVNNETMQSVVNLSNEKQETDGIEAVSLQSSSIATDHEEADKVTDVNPLANAGKTENVEIILATIAQFSEQQDAKALGRSGWIYQSYTLQLTKPEGQEDQDYYLSTGETIPRESLMPEIAVFENWYHVDGDKSFFEGVSLVSSIDGKIHQKSVLLGEDWVNLTLEVADPMQYSTSRATHLVQLPTSEALESLKMSAEWGADFQASWENENYIITVEYFYEYPLTEEATGLPEPVIGGKDVYTFNIETGELISSEGYILFESNKWHQNFNETYIPVEFQSTPPSDVVEILNNAINDYMEGN